MHAIDPLASQDAPGCPLPLFNSAQWAHLNRLVGASTTTSTPPFNCMPTMFPSSAFSDEALAKSSGCMAGNMSASHNIDNMDSSKNGMDAIISGNEDGMLRDEIARKIAKYLSGNPEGFSEDEEEEEEQKEKEEASPSGDRTSSPRPVIDSKSSPGDARKNCAAKRDGVSDGYARGKVLANELREVSLRMTKERVESLRYDVSHCISMLHKEKICPTLENVQRKLEEYRNNACYTKEMILVMCAKEVKFFSLAFQADGQITLLLCDELVGNAGPGSPTLGPCNPNFLDALKDVVEAKLAKVLLNSESLTPEVLPTSSTFCVGAATTNTPFAIAGTKPLPAGTTSLVAPALGGEHQDARSTKKTVASLDGATAPPCVAPSSGSKSINTGTNSKSGWSSHSMLTNLLQTQQITTLMVRNLPHNVTQKRLIEELANSGFAGLYDFCYMPSMFGTGVTKGYAFVNLTTPEAVRDFISAWHGSRRFGTIAPEPALNVSAAACQGREKNTRKWDAPRMRRIRNPALRPLVIDNLDKGFKQTDEKATTKALKLHKQGDNEVPVKSSKFLPPPPGLPPPATVASFMPNKSSDEINGRMLVHQSLQHSKWWQVRPEGVGESAPEWALDNISAAHSSAWHPSTGDGLEQVAWQSPWLQSW